MNRLIFPFTAIVGQEDMKLALILNVINPSIGGVLLKGQKGTGKSTCARSISELTPWLNLVELPLNATEDALIGGIDFEKALKHGSKKIRKGLLAQANNSILYIDEVNLLDDYLSQALLDAASSGKLFVEREGISAVFNTTFSIVASMNPEEGTLSPQLLDRFGMCVEIESETDIKARTDILRRKELFDSNPKDFVKSWSHAQDILRKRLIKARTILPAVEIPEEIRHFIATMCMDKNCAGHRAEIVMERASKAFCAFNNRDMVNFDDVIRISNLVLNHRMRQSAPPESKKQNKPDNKQEPDKPEKPQDKSEQQKDKEQTKDRPHQDNNTGDQQRPSGTDSKDNQTDDPRPDENQPPASGSNSGKEDVADIGEVFRIKKIEASKDRTARSNQGRRTRSLSSKRRGRYVRAAIPHGKVENISDIALDATIRAACLNKRKGPFIKINPSDIRIKKRQRRVGNLLLFVIDGSGSMGAQNRMEATKGAIMSLLMDAYQKRDRVGLIVFQGEGAKTLLAPTNSIELAARHLSDMPTGGKTPLAAGLFESAKLLSQFSQKDPFMKPIVLIVTDGRANVPMYQDKNSKSQKTKPLDEVLKIAYRMALQFNNTKFIVIDTELRNVIRLGLSKKLASVMNADYLAPEQLKASSLIDAVKKANNHRI